jgi:hypothetical protein
MKHKNSVTLGQALAMMVEELKLKPKLDEVRIRDGWIKLMGKPIAKYTQNISLSNGKLYIKVESAALQNELFYSREKIKELFNRELGEAVIHEVIVF